MKKLDGHLQKLDEENWKYKLVGLYFNVALAYPALIEANTQSHLLYLKTLDIADKIKKAGDEKDKDTLYGQYNLSIFDLCSQYQAIYDLLADDLHKVKTELLYSYDIRL
jgi:hypothetical protein